MRRVQLPADGFIARPSQHLRPYGVGIGGGAGTWFWADPTNDLFFVGMVQRLSGGVEDLRPMARVFTYGALVDPKK